MKMTPEHYEKAVDAVMNGGGWSGNSKRWNREFRERLEAVGLTLTDVDPIERHYMQAPLPTNQGDIGIKPHTPETDPYAWVIPSWMVEA